MFLKQRCINYPKLASLYYEKSQIHQTEEEAEGPNECEKTQSIKDTKVWN